MDLNDFFEPGMSDYELLAPSWSHGSKYQTRYVELFRLTRWLPRGAMDLNNMTSDQLPGVLGWLPRGAMDLNRK